MRWKLIIRRNGHAELTSNGVIVAAANYFDLEVLATMCAVTANVNQRVPA